MKKRAAALAVSSVMLLSSITSFAASGFSDLNEFHAWAEPQIEEMTTLGIIKGYTDGTFRPDQSITKTEALVLVSRAAGFVTKDYEPYKSAALTRYEELIETYNTPYPNEVAYLLYKDVLTEDDLAGYIAPGRADSPLLRYEMAVLLTKLMRAEDQLAPQGSFTLNYSDVGEIPFEASPYVHYTSNASLMQGVYDPEKPDEVFFNPHGAVTRAQMAVLLHRVTGKLDIDVQYYSILGKNTKNNTVTYRSEDGKTTLYTVKDNVNLIIDGYKTKSVSPVQTGANAAFFYINGTLCDIEIVNDEQNRWDGLVREDTVVPTDPIEGVITTIVLGEECSVVVNDCEYKLSAACTLYVNHIASTIYDLRVGHNVKLEFAQGKVIMVYASYPSDSSTQIVTTEGVITKLNLTNRRVHMDVENTQTGEVSEKLLIIETGAAIFNGISGQSIDFASLEIDNHIVATGTLKDDGNFYASKIIVR